MPEIRKKMGTRNLGDIGATESGRAAQGRRTHSTNAAVPRRGSPTSRAGSHDIRALRVRSIDMPSAIARRRRSRRGLIRGADLSIYAFGTVRPAETNH